MSDKLLFLKQFKRPILFKSTSKPNGKEWTAIQDEKLKAILNTRRKPTTIIQMSEEFSILVNSKMVPCHTPLGEAATLHPRSFVLHEAISLTEITEWTEFHCIECNDTLYVPFLIFIIDINSPNYISTALNPMSNQTWEEHEIIEDQMTKTENLTNHNIIEVIENVFGIVKDYLNVKTPEPAPEFFEKCEKEIKITEKLCQVISTDYKEVLTNVMYKIKTKLDAEQLENTIQTLKNIDNLMSEKHSRPTIKIKTACRRNSEDPGLDTRTQKADVYGVIWKNVDSAKPIFDRIDNKIKYFFDDDNLYDIKSYIQGHLQEEWSNIAEIDQPKNYEDVLTNIKIRCDIPHDLKTNIMENHQNLEKKRKEALAYIQDKQNKLGFYMSNESTDIIQYINRFLRCCKILQQIPNYKDNIDFKYEQTIHKAYSSFKKSNKTSAQTVATGNNTQDTKSPFLSNDKIFEEIQKELKSLRRELTELARDEINDKIGVCLDIFKFQTEDGKTMSVTQCIEFFNTYDELPDLKKIKTTVRNTDYSFDISLEDKYSNWKLTQLYDKSFATFMKTKFFLYLRSDYAESTIQCVSRSLLSEVIESIETSNMTEMTTNLKNYAEQECFLCAQGISKSFYLNKQISQQIENIEKYVKEIDTNELVAAIKSMKEDTPEEYEDFWRLYPFDEEKITNFNDLQTRVYDNIRADKTNKQDLEALTNTTILIYEVYANLLRHRKTNHTLEIDTDRLKCTITDPRPESRIVIDLQFIRILNEVLIFYLLYRLYLLKHDGDMQYEPRLDIYVNAALSFLLRTLR